MGSKMKQTWLHSKDQITAHPKVFNFSYRVNIEVRLQGPASAKSMWINVNNYFTISVFNQIKQTSLMLKSNQITLFRGWKSVKLTVYNFLCLKGKIIYTSSKNSSYSICLFKKWQKFSHTFVCRMAFELLTGKMNTQDKYLN